MAKDTLSGKVYTIRDPVHGYLRIAPHEQIVIDDPITQRLRHITQTGLAELVFPEARSSRFIHSLGAMHLASRFLINAIQNADESTALAFLNRVGRLPLFKNYQVDIDALDVLTDYRHAGCGLLSANVVFRHEKLRRDEKRLRRLLSLVEAAIRLAALFHDLGHLPFSHDFEFALKDHVANEQRQGKTVPSGLKLICRGTPHERIGHALAKLVFRALVAERRPEPGIRAAFSLARDILDNEEKYDEVPSPRVGVIGWMHSLIDGQIDADRADYLLRDARALGFEFANYDLDRLADNLILERMGQLGYATCVDERGLSALESFYVSRSRSNQFLVRHHKIAQFAAALRYATAAALRDTEQGHALLRDLVLIAKGLSDESAKVVLSRFARYDDAWWLETLRTMPRGNDVLLGASLDAVLERKRTLRSIWKRKGETERVINKINEITESAQDEQELFELRRQRLQQRNILLVVHRFTPYAIFSGGSPDSSVVAIRCREDDQHRWFTAASISTLIKSTHFAWTSDIHMHAFAPSGLAATPQQVARWLSWRPARSSRRRLSRRARRSPDRNREMQQRRAGKGKRR